MQLAAALLEGSVRRSTGGMVECHPVSNPAAAVVTSDGEAVTGWLCPAGGTWDLGWAVAV